MSGVQYLAFNAPIVLKLKGQSSTLSASNMQALPGLALMAYGGAVLQDILLAFLGSAGGFVETAVLRASDGPHLAFTFAQQDADEYVCDLACRLLPVW